MATSTLIEANRLTREQLAEVLHDELHVTSWLGRERSKSWLAKQAKSWLIEQYLQALADADRADAPAGDAPQQTMAPPLDVATPAETAEDEANDQRDAVVDEQAPPLVNESTALALRDEIGVVEQHRTLPEVSRWDQIMAMSRVLAGSQLVQQPLRDKPDDVALILLASHDLGISATQGLQKLFVLDGKVSMSAELMVALVLSAGHELWAEESTRDHVVVCGKRRGAAHTSRVTWTIDDAAAAGLCSIVDGKPRSRDRNDKPKPWERYPQSMLWARAVSQLCRMMFADVLAGVSYTPEELGDVEVDVEGRVIDVSPQASASHRVQPPATAADPQADADPLLLEEQRTKFQARIDALSESLKTDLVAEWSQLLSSKQLRGLKQARQSEHVRIDELISKYEAIDTAGEVFDTPSTTSAPAEPVDDVIEIVECPNCKQHVASDRIIEVNGHTYCADGCEPI